MFLHVIDRLDYEHALNVFHISKISKLDMDTINFYMMNGEVVSIQAISLDEMISKIEILRKAACTSSR